MVKYGTQQPDYAVPRLPEIYQKPLSWGHLTITDETLVPKSAIIEGFHCVSLAPENLLMCPDPAHRAVFLLETYILYSRKI